MSGFPWDNDEDLGYYAPTTTPTKTKEADQTQEVSTVPNILDKPHGRKSLETQGLTDRQVKVNWLGSSYSGADVKVVAHLYNQDESLFQKLETRLLIVDSVLDAIDGFFTLFTGAIRLSDVIPEGTRNISAYVLGAIGAMGYRAETRDIITGELIGVGLSNKGLVSPMLARASALRSKFEAEQVSAQEKIKVIKEGKVGLTNTLVLGNLQTLSVQSHREKSPVRALGNSHVNGHVWGPRTFAGTMIFTTFQEHPLRALIQAMKDSGTYDTRADKRMHGLSPDQIPPVDLTIVFANEYGSISRMGIYGVEFFADAITFSSEDLFSENVVNYMARDVDIMTEVGNVKLSRYERSSVTRQTDISATDLLYNTRQAYNDYVNDSLGLRRELKAL